MDIINIIFQNRVCSFERLIDFGFRKKGDTYFYKTVLSSSGFEMNVSVTEQGSVSAMVWDTDLNEPYTLHLVSGAVGEFVGKIKSEYEEVLNSISDQCFEPDVFKTVFAKKIITYVHSKYGNEPEYLWNRFPDNAVVRRSDNKKWYLAILTVSRSKLGFKSDEIVEAIDLRMKPEEVEKIDRVNIYQAII